MRRFIWPPPHSPKHSFVLSPIVKPFLNLNNHRFVLYPYSFVFSRKIRCTVYSLWVGLFLLSIMHFKFFQVAVYPQFVLSYCWAVFHGIDVPLCWSSHKLKDIWIFFLVWGHYEKAAIKLAYKFLYEHEFSFLLDM